MKHIILNTAILTDFGVFTFRPASIEEAKKWLSEQPFESSVGHQGTADVMTALLGVAIPCARVEAHMGVGDQALVFKPCQRLPEGKVLSREELARLPYTLGILSRDA